MTNTFGGVSKSKTLPWGRHDEKVLAQTLFWYLKGRFHYKQKQLLVQSMKTPHAWIKNKGNLYIRYQARNQCNYFYILLAIGQIKTTFQILLSADRQQSRSNSNCRETGSNLNKVNLVTKRLIYAYSGRSFELNWFMPTENRTRVYWCLTYTLVC